MTNPLDDLAKIIETPFTVSHMAELAAIHDRMEDAAAPIELSIDLTIDEPQWGKTGSGGTTYSDTLLAIAPSEYVLVRRKKSLSLGFALPGGYMDDPRPETPREHNERKYPDLMNRLDRLNNHRDN
jgi:hypothetical protein